MMQDKRYLETYFEFYRSRNFEFILFIFNLVQTY